MPTEAVSYNDDQSSPIADPIQNQNIDGGTYNMKHISRNHVSLTKLPLLPRIPLQNVALGSPAHSQIKLEEIPNIKICTRIIFSKESFHKGNHSASCFLFTDPTLQFFPPLEVIKEEILQNTAMLFLPLLFP